MNWLKVMEFDNYATDAKKREILINIDSFEFLKVTKTTDNRYTVSGLVGRSFLLTEDSFRELEKKLNIKIPYSSI